MFKAKFDIAIKAGKTQEKDLVEVKSMVTDFGSANAFVLKNRRLSVV